MIRLYCKGNVIEYTGDGWIQCSRQVACPKKRNNKILGFDCLSYIDNLPENVKLLSSEMELSRELKDTKVKEIKEPIKEIKEPTMEIKEVSGVSDNQNDTKEYISPIITVPSREEIDKQMIEKEKNGHMTNGILVDISPLIHLQKQKLAEKAQA